MTRKRKIALILLALMLAGLLLIPAGAAEKTLPSLFCNDEAWYKDSAEPLVIRDGKAYVPTEFWTMFDGITVTVPASGNLLVQNTATGKYVSVLYPECTAAVNGRIVENVGVLRNEDMYYLEVTLTCSALGLKSEFFAAGDGAEGLRVSDENCQFTLSELLEAYTTQPDDYDRKDTETGDSQAGEEKAPRLFFLCGIPKTEALYEAIGCLREAGLGFTVFVDVNDSPAAIYDAVSAGEIGLVLPRTQEGTPDIGTLDALNERVMHFTGRRTRLVLCDREERDTVRNAGYFPVTSDFISVGGLDYAELESNVVWTLSTKGSCTVWLEDYWVSKALIDRFTGLRPDDVLVRNLADS